MQAAELQRALAHVVHQPTRGSDDNLYAAFKLPNLAAIFLAPVNRQNMKSFDVRRVMLKRFGHLDSQLASRRERQYLDVLVLHVDAGQQRQGKSGCLAGARGCMPENVPATQQQRYRLALDRRRCFIADLIQHSYKGLGQLQIAKTGRAGAGIGLGHCIALE